MTLAGELRRDGGPGPASDGPIRPGQPAAAAASAPRAIMMAVTVTRPRGVEGWEVVQVQVEPRIVTQAGTAQPGQGFK